MKSNEKGFCRHVASKRKATVSMDLLIYMAGDTKTTDTERAEVLNMLSYPTLILWSSLARFALSSTRSLNLLAECVGKKSSPPIHEDTGSSHKPMHPKDTKEAVWFHCKATLYCLWWLGQFSGDSRKASIFFMKGKEDVESYRSVSLTSVSTKGTGPCRRHFQACEKWHGNSQSGFTKDKSCPTNLIVCYNETTVSVDNGKAVDVI